MATGLGVEQTTAAVAEGFGNLMAEVGLIIGFGVLLGSLLSATGTLQRRGEDGTGAGHPRRTRCPKWTSRA
ncbi:hypothetical protein GCM10009545_38010 [Saccharopolyspora thermophila]|uniref:Uncharacterized protein n=1 Tax=Saccharopolyspora thermophila TaxID=89367 RepID=A0ABP3N3T0_9PSEU